MKTSTCLLGVVFLIFQATTIPAVLADAPWNDDCSAVTPEALVAGGQLTYQDNNTNATSDCSLLNFPEVWYAFTTTECLDVTIDYCGTAPAFTNMGVVLVTGCPCAGTVYSTMYDWTTCGDGNPTLYYFRLPPGTYYVPVLSAGSYQHAYTLNIRATACLPVPPNNSCANVTPVTLNLGDELTFTGDTRGATQTCDTLGWPGDVWDAIVTTQPLDITVDYCSTAPAFGIVGDMIFSDCPCAGDFNAGLKEFTSCGDGNATIHYYHVPAGTWYIPTYSGLSALGPYTMHVRATPASAIPECPSDALYSQPPQATGAYLVAPTSAQTSQFDYLCQEDFSSVTHKIGSLRWWGMNLRFDGNHNQWLPCEPDGVPFEVIFYKDNNGAPGVSVFTFMGVTPTVVETGLSYEDYALYEYSIDAFPECISMENGWISIQSQSNPNDCAFLWISSPIGDFLALQNGAMIRNNLAFCLGAGDCPGIYGACCNELTAQCTNNVDWSDCVGPYLRFTPNTDCIDVYPPCGEVVGACCQTNGTCEITSPMECEAAYGTWIGADTVCDDCPAYCRGGTYFCREYVSRVQLGSIDNSTGCGLGSGGVTGYSNYTGIETELTIGEEYVITVENGSTSYPEDACGVWIDWNGNYSFDDDGEYIAMTGSPGVGPYSATITPPVNAAHLVRMRVRVDLSGPGACGYTYPGEVEDYALRVVARPCPGDLDHDGDVDISDLAELLSNYGQSSGASFEDGDMDGDGDVDISDLAALLAVYGTTCP